MVKVFSSWKTRCIDLYQSYMSLNCFYFLSQGSTTKVGEINMTHSNLRKKTIESGC